MLKHRWLKYALAWILLLGVFLVCVSPAVDLDDCSLSADQFASLVSWLFGALLLLTMGVQSSPQRQPLPKHFVDAAGPCTPMDCFRLDVIGTRRI